MRPMLVLVTTALYLSATPSIIVGQESASGWQRQIVTDGPVSLEIFVKGTGVPILMHPGGNRPARDLTDLGNRVSAAGYRVVLINARGAGASTGPTEGLTTADLSADVWMVADKLKFGEVHLLGHAFGNRVMRTASTSQPERAITITLLAAGGEIVPGAGFQAARARVANSDLPRSDRLNAIRQAFFAPGQDPAPWADILDRTSPRLNVDPQAGMSEWYTGGTAPMLIVQGLEDVTAPPENAWNLVNSRPNARLVAIPNCGHAMIPEQPLAIANAVISFLQELAK